MSLELKLIKLSVYISTVLIATSFIPSSLFLNVVETKVNTEGVVTFTRVPLYDGIVLTYSHEVSSPDGRTCTGTQGETAYEVRDSNTISYLLEEKLMPCVEKGSTHRVVRRYKWFAPHTTETVID